MAEIRVSVTLTVTVDPTEWNDNYGVAAEGTAAAVRQDVKGHVLEMVRELESRGVGVSAVEAR
jgi:hypothetical protein